MEGQSGWDDKSDCSYNEMRLTKRNYSHTVSVWHWPPFTAATLSTVYYFVWKLNIRLAVSYCILYLLCICTPSTLFISFCVSNFVCCQCAKWRSTRSSYSNTWVSENRMYTNLSSDPLTNIPSLSGHHLTRNTLAVWPSNSTIRQPTFNTISSTKPWSAHAIIFYYTFASHYPPKASFSSCTFIGPSLQRCTIKIISKISYKLSVEISPNSHFRCSWRQRWTNYIFR